ncbi:MAG: ferrous iron transport protein B [Firmicutes bacterium HGW-Firmicutes-10]|jgi:ferrous iron transport protein B|nr:MAG: ferrous iron transport protein B [Firmicutes bacterium HGW-Firmicutes-10]
MGLHIALVGNPNSGKTTLFNDLTGSNQYVGNWPGVTVEKKTGKAKHDQLPIDITDLPGIYSFSTYTLEEVIAREFVEGSDVDVIINIVDASNIERNLFLTLQLLEMRKPMVIAMNMMDVLQNRGTLLDCEALSRQLNVPIVPIVASKSVGIKQLLQAAVDQMGIVPPLPMIYNEQLENVIQLVERKLPVNVMSRMHAVRFVEEGGIAVLGHTIDPVFLAQLNEEVEKKIAFKSIDRDMVISDEKYAFITNLVQGVTTQIKEKEKYSLSDKIDSVVTHRIFAIPIFLLIMFGLFSLSFGPVGSFFKANFEWLIQEGVIVPVASILELLDVSDWLYSLVVDGILGGVGSVLSFLPEITILFLTLSILEDTGYMARAAFIMDRLLRKFGLSGRSFIPMIMGFGCTVPALMATRTLESERDRRLTMMITPFMSCGARFPIYAVFAAAFFVNSQATVVFSIYLLGIFVAVISGIVLKRFVTKGKISSFIMELPEYRWPTPKNLFLHTWDRVKGFIIKAGTVILVAMVIIWFLQSFDFSFRMVDDSVNSIFGIIGTRLAVLFQPLGFGDWRSAMSLIVGLVAKEAVVGTLGVLYGVGEAAVENPELLSAPLRTMYTPLSAYAFMAFTLLYMPCIAAFAAMKREMNSWKWTLIAVSYQTVVAWLVAFIIYQGGLLIGLR